MYTLRVKSHFDAAHFLPWHEGKCKNLHGHRWEVEVSVQIKELEDTGIVVDFGLVKDMLKRVVPDHQPLNEGEYLISLIKRFLPYSLELATMALHLGNWIENPTAERIANKLTSLLQHEFKMEELSFESVEVCVWESPNCSVTYRPEE